MMTYKELLEHGDNFHTYVGRGTHKERQDVAKIIARLENGTGLRPDTLGRLVSIEEDYHLLAAGEMWCPDCRINITAMNKLCELQPRLKLSVISKGRAEDEIMEELGLDEILIPVVAVLNSDYEVVGQFIERPDVIADLDDIESVKVDYSEGAYMDATIREIIDHIV